MTELGQGDAGEGGYYGGLGGSMTMGPGPTTGNIEGQHGIYADAQAWHQAQQEQEETVRDLQLLAHVKGVEIGELGDLQRIAADLTRAEKAKLAATPELGWMARIKYSFQANSMPLTLSTALPGFMAPIGVAMGTLQTLFTGKVGATPDPNTSYIGPERTMLEWLNDPKVVEQLQGQIPTQEIEQMRQEFKAQTDRVVASAFVRSQQSSGMGGADREQHIDTLVANWNTGKGGYDKSIEVGTPRWLNEYLRQGTIPDFLTSSASTDTPEIPADTPVETEGLITQNEQQVTPQPAIQTPPVEEQKIPMVPQKPLPAAEQKVPAEEQRVLTSPQGQPELPVAGNKQPINARLGLLEQERCANMQS